MQNKSIIKSACDKDFELGFFERLGPKQLLLQTLIIAGIPYGATYGTCSTKASFWFSFLWFWGILLSFIGIGTYFFDENKYGVMPFVCTSIGFAKMALACYIESKNIKRKVDNKYLNYLSTLDKDLLAEAKSSPLLDNRSKNLINVFLSRDRV